MAAGYWIKLYQDILRDPKMGRLSDSAWRRCIELFLMAGEQKNRDGFLPALEDTAWELRVSVQQMSKDLAELEAAGILKQVDGRWLVVNFKKRQAAVDVKERVQRHREKKAVTAQPVEGNEAETNGKQAGNDSVTNRYTDIDIDKDKNTPLPPNGGASVSKTQTLVSYFSNQSKINPPNGKQKVAWREGWIEPLNEILDLTADDVTAACTLIDRALAHMRQNDLTIARPSSISSVAKMLHNKTTPAASVPNGVDTAWKEVKAQAGRREAPAFSNPLILSAVRDIWPEIKKMTSYTEKQLRATFEQKYQELNHARN